MRKENIILLGLGGLTIIQNLFNQNNDTNKSRKIDKQKLSKKKSKNKCQEKQIKIVVNSNDKIDNVKAKIKKALKATAIQNNKSCNLENNIEIKIEIQEAKVEGKVDLGEKPWGVSCDAFSGVTTITKVGDCTMTAKTSNCRKVGDNCVCDVQITTEGNCDL